jgi:cell division protein FtsW (lipid II flippase)
VLPELASAQSAHSCAQPTEPAKEAEEEPRPIEIPVVESDFAAAYLISRFGTGAGRLFFLGQFLLVLVCLYGFLRVSFTARTGGGTEESIRRFVAITLAGASMLFVLQWVFSWSNILGLTPIMGQPMTWLSHAPSHHAFMAIPCLLVMVIGLRYAGTSPFRYTPRDPPRFSHLGR